MLKITFLKEHIDKQYLNNKQALEINITRNIFECHVKSLSLPPLSLESLKIRSESIKTWHEDKHQVRELSTPLTGNYWLWAFNSEIIFRKVILVTENKLRLETHDHVYYANWFIATCSTKQKGMSKTCFRRSKFVSGNFLEIFRYS